MQISAETIVLNFWGICSPYKCIGYQKYFKPFPNKDTYKSTNNRNEIRSSLRREKKMIFKIHRGSIVLTNGYLVFSFHSKTEMYVSDLRIY